MKTRPPALRLMLGLSALALLAACDGDIDFRRLGPGMGGDPRPATVATAPRPAPDARGVISYPGYQVAVAERDDTPATVAARIGLGAEELARYNGLATDTRLRQGEILAMPRRVAEPRPAGGLDIASIAGGAIDRAGGAPVTSSTLPPPATTTPAPAPAPGVQPIRHRVERGETAYSIARLYNVSPRALADWNGLGADMALREGQYLLIPVAAPGAPAPLPAVAVETVPGQGSPTPVPPSAARPLPEAVTPAVVPPSPKLDQYKTEDAGTKFLPPVSGSVLRAYKKGTNDGIDLAAAEGTAVKAAADGEVALISRSVGQSTIVLLRHESNLYTVYSNVVEVKVAKGDKVKRGQPLAQVASGSPSFLHFEVRKGTESTDPAPYLN
jgi:LysM repeat protein